MCVGGAEMCVCVCVGGCVGVCVLVGNGIVTGQP
jgi:hypothetical protein